MSTQDKKIDSGDANRRPYGREEIRAALLDAANELFGLKGPDAVSVRDVAKLADVNHALLHRHFGSKEQLLRDLMEQHAASFRHSSSQAKDAYHAVGMMFDLMLKEPSFIRIVAQLLLTGHQPDEFVTRQGGLAKLQELVALEHPDLDEDQTKLIAAASSAFSMGWLLFEPFVLKGVGYDGKVSAARSTVASAIQKFIEAKP